MTQHPPPGVQPERINLNDKATTDAWSKKLNASWEQLREAVAAVGDKVTNVEKHLKGRSGPPSVKPVYRTEYKPLIKTFTQIRPLLQSITWTTTTSFPNP